MERSKHEIIYIFAGNRADALVWANGHELGATDWVWVKSPNTLRLVFSGWYVTLESFESHPDWVLLCKMIELRQMRHLHMEEL